MSANKKLDQQTIVNHLKVYGFVFPCSSIYGGIANGWDYGPVGTLLKKNIKDLWWREYVTKVPNAVGLDSSIILNPQVWKASGHLSSFTDPLIDCKECHNRFRADNLIEDATGKTIGENTPFDEIKKMVDKNHINSWAFQATVVLKSTKVAETNNSTVPVNVLSAFNTLPSKVKCS